MKNLLKFKNFLLAVFVLFAHAVIAQTITGTVSSEDGPLPGATIIVKGTNNGTTTDFDGNFSIEASSSDVLVVSFVGFSSQEVSVGDNDQITVNLQADNELEEVVITGYGSQKEKEITSAVTKITADEFNKGPINTTAGLLEGKVAGLSIYSKGGNPNAGSTIRLRGITSFGDNTSPLFVIDGVPGSSIDNVDPNDIETINVLKDGSAAAIYGSRGSSGVIIVTTKKGSQGRVKLSYNGQYGVSEKMNQIKIMTPAEFRAFGGADLGGNVANFADEVTRQAASSIHNISAAGGFDNTTFRVSANLRDVEGVVKRTGFTQANFRANIQTKALNDKLTVGINTSYTRRQADLGNPSVLEFANIFNPTAPIYFKDAPQQIQDYFTEEQIRKSGGYFQTLGLFRSFNPVAIQEQGVYKQDKNEFEYGFNLDYALTDDLTIYASAANFRSSAENRTSRSVYDYNTQANLGDRPGRVSFNDFENSYENYQVYGTFAKQFSGLDLTVTAGYDYYQSNFFSKGIDAGDFPNEAIDWSFSLGSSEDLLTGNRIGLSSFKAPTSKLIAGFGRVNLVIDNGIYVNAGVRREGSNKLGKENYWGVFPSAGVGVDLNKYLGTSFDKLKVRVGYGTTGNLPSQNGLSQKIFTFSNATQATTQARAANPDLKWEEKTEINFGVEYRNGPLDATFDIYTRKITDFISETEVDAAVYGFNRRFENAGDISAEGFELSLSYEVNDQWTPSLVLSSNQSTIDKYTTKEGITTGNLGSPGQNSTNMVLVKEGYALGTIWGPVYDGVDAATGKPKFKDVNGDGQIIAGQDKALDPLGDFTKLGDGIPTLEIGFNNNVNLGRIQVNAFFQAALGHSLVNTWRAFFEPRIGSQFAYNFINTKYADDNLKAAAFSSLYVEKADYFKLANLTVSYDLGIAGNTISSASVSLNVRNAFVITDYTGADPTPSIVDGGYDAGGGSLSNTGNILAPGIDRRNNYFDSRSFTLGLNINF